jgi:hypothetical protein
MSNKRIASLNYHGAWCKPRRGLALGGISCYNLTSKVLNYCVG